MSEKNSQKTEKQPLTLIKLGGSIITNKEVPMMVRDDVLQRLVKEIARARQETGDLYIVGHGSGSFGHVAASNYDTMHGFTRSDSRMGMAITQDSAAQLNRIVVRSFLAEQIPAVTFAFSNSLVTASHKPVHWCSGVLEEYLEQGLVPITGGDVIVDKEQGCTIWSTEEILNHIALHFRSKEYFIRQIIHVTEVDGVLNEEGRVIPLIEQVHVQEVEKYMKMTRGFDVTGGMWHKVQESLAVARQDISSVIMSGLQPGNVYRALTQQEFLGTVVR